MREASEPRAWSRGVHVARGEGGVSEDRCEAGEVVLWVEDASGHGHTVQLDLEGLDWACGCEAEEDPCAHVCAAVIAAQQARRSGRPLPRRRAPEPGRIGYRLRRTPQGLDFQRVLVRAGGEAPLHHSVATLALGRSEGPVHVTPADREVERVLGRQLSGTLLRSVWPRLLRALAGVSDLTLDGERIYASTQARGVVAELRERGRGFFLRLVQDPEIEEIFPSGVVRCQDRLHPVATPDLSSEELQRYKRGVFFEEGEAARLVGEVLPWLETRVPVHVKARRLPGRSDAAPRIHLETRREGDGLSVLATLVYGDPPVARVDAGRLVRLGDAPVPKRDEAAERRLVHELMQTLGLELGRRQVFTGASAMEMARRIEACDGPLRSEAHVDFLPAPALLPHFEVHEDGFDLSFESPGRGTVAGRVVIEAWLAGQAHVLLDGGGMAPLPSDWLERFGPLLADLYAARGERAELPAVLLPDLARLCEALEVPPPPRFERLQTLLAGEGQPEPSLPPDLRATLRGYQREGVRWLAALRDAGLGGLLADDMGLGKTLQALAVLEGRSLVVAPTSVLHNWVDEARRFRPGLVVQRYHGPTRRLDPSAQLVVTSYGVLRQDADRLAEVSWDAVVLDEAQAIKNPDSQVARAAYRLPGRFRLALTGTPVENRLEELWSALHFATPGLLGSRTDFDRRYARPIAAGEVGVAERLRRRIKPFVLRRLKSEVARELPPRTDRVLRCHLAPEERALYDAVAVAAREEVARHLSQDGGVMAALEALLRLRQAACHPGLLPGQRADRSAKVDLLLETLEEVVSEGHRSLVFSQWTSLLDRIEPHLEAAGIAFLRLDGSTRDREAVVRRFQAEEGPPVMLVSLKAGGSGLNLTAADHVFLLDPWWNPAVEDQAAGRAHRIGQVRPVVVHRLIAADTVDERILELQERKRGLAEAALGEADAAARLSREDLLALLEG
ncbi:MAG: DEAD/DEAH box helicase [Deltaproteobacteria bacterium]|nr:MAG: DEAD/DEAH box helicase [Deltaproteobacteria bacterium]